MKFNKKLPTIFLDPHLEYEKTDSKVNVILSPSLYWVKKISLPVKYVRDAKQLLPSIFEDILPEGSYSYFAYKSDDQFMVFAYSDKLILDTLSQKGISLSSVAKIYFAQSEIKDIEGALKINETQSIYLKDDMLILVPCCWIEEKGDLDLADIKHSKHNISLQQFGHIVDTKSLYKIAAILMVLIMIVGTEYFITTQKISSVISSQDKLFDKYNLKSTTFQNKALLKKYETIHLSQTKIREYMSYILSIKLQNGVKISLISIKNKKILVNFIGIKKGSKTNISKFLKSKKIPFNSNITKDIMRVEVNL